MKPNNAAPKREILKALGTIWGLPIDNPGVLKSYSDRELQQLMRRTRMVKLTMLKEKPSVMPSEILLKNLFIQENVSLHVGKYVIGKNPGTSEEFPFLVVGPAFTKHGTLEKYDTALACRTVRDAWELACHRQKLYENTGEEK